MHFLKLSNIAMALVIWLMILIIGTVSCSGAENQKRCDVALVLAMDVSDSIKLSDYQLQLQGTANAFTNQKTIDAIVSGGHGCIHVAITQWSGNDTQSLVLDWMTISNREESENVAALITAIPRNFQGYTAIAKGIDHALAVLENGPPANRHIIDISGDGYDNDSHGDFENPISIMKRVHAKAINAGVIINGLPIINSDSDDTNGELVDYYKNSVILDGFVVPANNFIDFERAILTKLIQEIS